MNAGSVAIVAGLLLSVAGCASHKGHAPDAASGMETREAGTPSAVALSGAAAELTTTNATFEPVRVAPSQPEAGQVAGTQLRQIGANEDGAQNVAAATSNGATSTGAGSVDAASVKTSASTTSATSNSDAAVRSTATSQTPATVAAPPSSPTDTQPVAPASATISGPAKTAALTTTTTDAGLARLVELMCGEFSSAAQATADPDYRDISLKIARIWPGNSDGHWLYVEQAVTTMLDRPYRQRIYHVTSVPNTKVPTYRSEVFTLPGDARKFVGAWKDVSRFNEVSPSALEVRTGCAVMLTMAGPDRFTGSTVDRNCQSEFQKASYATSEVVITPSGMVSWDRGFDNDGKQVWGATGGGYKFVRAGTLPGAAAAPEK